MKKFISVAAVSLIFGLSMMISGCSQKVPQGIILAEYDSKAVKADELEKEISELPEWKQSQYKDQAGRAEYLTLMAESRMLLQVALEKGLSKDPEIVKQTQEYKDQLLVKELVKREVDDQIKITDEDLKKYYEDHKADYVEPEKVSVTEITLKDEGKAKEAMEKIKGGVDFVQLAKEMDAKGESFGPGQGNEGKTRPFARDSYSSAQKFVETAFSLEVGAMSDIIVQPLGDQTYYMIIKVNERIPSRQQEFSEVESQVRSTVENEKKKDRMDKWLNTLKVEHRFQLYPDRIPKVAEEKKEAEAGKEGAVEKEAEKKAEVEKTNKAVETPGEQKTPGEKVETPSEQKTPGEAEKK